MTVLLSTQQVDNAAPDGWVNLLDGLQTRIRTGDFATGLLVVNAIGAVAEQLNHHPDLDLRYTHVDVRLTSHDSGGITERDIRLAEIITTIAADAEVPLDGAGLSRIEYALDTPAQDTVAPFWGAVLAMEQVTTAGNEADLRDPNGVLPIVWFQESGDDEPRQRWHPDVWVDPAAVQPRIDAALAAGGTLVSDTDAPGFWVLADPEGNKVCLCTWRDR